MNVAIALSDEDVERVARRVVAVMGENTPAADPLLTVEEAADYLRCSRQRLYDLVSAARLKPGRDGKRLLFRRSVLDRYLEHTA